MNPYDACLKKKAYASEHEAKSMGAMQELLWGIKLKVYKCPRCKKFHLTHKDAEGILYETNL